MRVMNFFMCAGRFGWYGRLFPPIGWPVGGLQRYTEESSFTIPGISDGRCFREVFWLFISRRIRADKLGNRGWPGDRSRVRLPEVRHRKPGAFAGGGARPARRALSMRLAAHSHPGLNYGCTRTDTDKGNVFHPDLNHGCTRIDTDKENVFHPGLNYGCTRTDTDKGNVIPAGFRAGCPPAVVNHTGYRTQWARPPRWPCPASGAGLSGLLVLPGKALMSAEGATASLPNAQALGSDAPCHRGGL